MLILTQDRTTLVNIDYYDTLTTQHATLYPPESERSEVVGIRTDFSTGYEEKTILGEYVNRESAEAILANIAVAARAGENAYIME